jgi:hypothetical protein
MELLNEPGYGEEGESLQGNVIIDRAPAAHVGVF